FPLSRLDAAIDCDQLPLAEVLGADLCQAIPGDDRVVLGLLLAAPVVVGRHRELGDRLAARERAHLGIASQTAGEQDTVHANASWTARGCATVMRERRTASWNRRVHGGSAGRSVCGS